MTKAMFTRKPIIYHVLRLQQDGDFSRAEAIRAVEDLRYELAPMRNGKKKELSLPKLSEHLGKSEQSPMEFQQATWGWKDETFSNTGGKNPVRRGKRKAPAATDDS